MNPCTRRTLLVATSAAVVAGCLDETSGASDPSGGSDDEPATTTDDPSNSDGTPDQPNPGVPTSCPEYGNRVERVVCYDEIDPEETDVYLEPDRDSASEGEEIAFTLKNAGEGTLTTNFHNWRVDKYVEGEWYHVAPMGVPMPAMSVGPGESHTWTVTVDNDGLESAEPVRSGGTEDVTLPAVGAGHYAFRARGWLESEDHEDATAFAARFHLLGDLLEFAPSNAIEEVGWSDDTLLAASTRGDPDGEYSRKGAFELERVDGLEPAGTGDNGSDESGDEPQRVITEQLFRYPQLRDSIALALEHDADRVRLEEYSATIPVFGSRSDGIYEYRGEYYWVSTRELE